MEARGLTALVMGEKDEIEVSIGTDGGKLKLSGDVADRTSRGIGDLLKPFIQFFGDKGDEIEFRRDVKREIRVFNKLALQQCLQATLDMARRQGIAIQPVPIKTLAQWAEGASLEDHIAPNNLKLLWARLLVSEIIHNNPNSIIYSGFLKQMTREHADFLEGICKKQDAKYFSTQAAKITEERIASLVEPVLRPYWETGFPNDEVEKTLSALFSAFDIPSLHVFSFSANAKTKQSIKDHEFSIDFTARPIPRHSIVRESLEVLGLVKRVFVETSSGGLDVNCHYVTLTDLGMDFVASCIAERQN